MEIGNKRTRRSYEDNMQNLVAFTDEGTNYPPFFSVNKTERGVEISVRNHPRGGMCGDTATVIVSDSTWAQILADAVKGTVNAR